jgi:hypothetical protein
MSVGTPSENLYEKYCSLCFVDLVVLYWFCRISKIPWCRKYCWFSGRLYYLCYMASMDMEYVTS